LEIIHGEPVSYNDIIRAIGSVRGGRLGKYQSRSLTSYIICPETDELWDLKPVVGLTLETARLNPKSIHWVTTSFEPQLLRLGFSIVKFHAHKSRSLGLHGFSAEDIQDPHYVLQAPTGQKIENCLASYVKQSASRLPVRTSSTATRFIRDSSIALTIRTQSNGYCDLCGKRTFQTGDGDWFIEIHHKKWLSEGGLDIVENLVPLCPTCHRSEHYGKKRKYL
jgi:5-methylcytosine-specific restriction enzyme A